MKEMTSPCILCNPQDANACISCLKGNSSAAALAITGEEGGMHMSSHHKNADISGLPAEIESALVNLISLIKKSFPGYGGTHDRNTKTVEQNKVFAELEREYDQRL